MLFVAELHGNLAVQHNPAALACAAVTGVIGQPAFLKRAGQIEVVVIENFFAFADFAQRANVDAAVFFNGVAIRRARMIGKLRGVSAPARVNQPTVVERKDDRVMRVGLILVHVGQIVGRHARALVFDDLRALGNVLACEQAAAVQFALFDEPVFAARGYGHKSIGLSTFTGSRI